MLKKTVLIVEDSGIISLDLKLLLKKFNINSEIVRTPGSLIEETRLLRPDLIISELNLGARQLLKDALGEVSKTYHIPIILISSSLRADIEDFAQSLSSCTVLTEPFESSEILSLVQKYVFFEPASNYCYN